MTGSIKEMGANKKVGRMFAKWEDNKLFRLYNMYPTNWQKISSFMQDRNAFQCKNRYQKTFRFAIKKDGWTYFEDLRVLELVKQKGFNWKQIADELGTKTNSQIRQRYLSKMTNSLKGDEWTQQEDMKIVKLYSKFGNKWTQIVKNMTGRSYNCVRNRFYRFLAKQYFPNLQHKVEVKKLKVVLPTDGDDYKFVDEENFSLTSNQQNNKRQSTQKSNHCQSVKYEKQKDYDRDECSREIEERSQSPRVVRHSKVNSLYKEYNIESEIDEE